jgi:ABC-type nitrate/sulfonate/bicarbonate transport system permease component
MQQRVGIARALGHSSGHSYGSEQYRARDIRSAARILSPAAAACLSKAAAVEQINAAYSMGADLGQVIRHIIIPAALPEILVGLRIAIGFGWPTALSMEIEES